MKRASDSTIIRESTARSSSVIAVGALASRIAGWARVTVLIAIFGATGTLDPFLAAFRIPDIVFALVAAGSIATVLVPQLSSLLERGEQLRARRLLGSVFVAMALLLAFFSLLVVLGASGLSGLLVGGLPSAQQREAADLSLILLVATVALALSAICTSAAAARSKFGVTAITGLVYSAGTIAGALVGGREAGGYGPAVGTAVGAIAVLVIAAIVLIRSNLRPARPNFGDPLLREALRSLLPRVGSVLLVQLLLAYLVSLAGTTGAGAITVWSYAFTLLQVPLALVTSSIGIAVLPKIAAQAARGNRTAVRTLATSSIGTVIWMMAPIATLGTLFSYDAVRLVVGGTIDDASAVATAELLRLLLVGLVAHGVISVAVRLFYGLRDTLRPTVAEIGGNIVIFVLASLWVPILGVTGIATSLPLGSWVEAVALMALLIAHKKVISAATVVGTTLFALLAALLSLGLAAFITTPLLDGARAAGVIPGAAVATLGTVTGLSLYVALTILARRREALPLLRRVAPLAPQRIRPLLLRAEASR
ncbi:MAG: lipid II flippase MurJ [Candidatus Limnocylindrus sp.]